MKILRPYHILLASLRQAATPLVTAPQFQPEKGRLTKELCIGEPPGKGLKKHTNLEEYPSTGNTFVKDKVIKILLHGGRLGDLCTHFALSRHP